MYDLFAEEYHPYQHLEEYEEQCWLQNMAIISQQLSFEAHGCPYSAMNVRKNIEHASTLEFEPFEVESTALRTGNDFHQQTENHPEISLLPSDEEHISQLTASNLNNEGIDSEWRPSIAPLNEENQPQTKEKKKISLGISFNTTDYIVKHCFKRMLSQDFKQEVQTLCQEKKITYSSFCLFWKRKLDKYLPNKHIGLTKFMKMIDQTQSNAVIVCRLFLTLYLWRDYPQYVTIGGMRNKQEYLRCATKLMYISCLPKRGSDIKYHAQKL